MRARWCLLVGLVASGCASTGAQDPCSPAALKLPSAKPLAVWQPPAGCTPRQVQGPLWIASDADADKAFDCQGTKLGVDFTKTAVVIDHRTLSPAQTGVVAFDDGATITMVDRMRRPCPDERPPMPVPSTTVFQAPAGRARVFAVARCTVDTRCP